MKLNFNILKVEIIKIISKYINLNFSLKLDEDELLTMISETKDSKNGDFSFPLFIIGKKIGLNPSEISKSMVKFFNEKILNSKTINSEKTEEDSTDISICHFIEKIEASGPYLNFWINKKLILNELLVNKDFNPYHIENLKESTVVIDYSSCNIAKPYGIGHIMSTAIGESLKRCYEYLGSKVIGINYIGDWGTQFGKVLLSYQLWGNDDELEKRGVFYLYDLYVKFHEKEEDDPQLSAKAKEVFQKLEENDEFYHNLWEKFRKISLENFDKYYKLFGNTFTLIEGESKYSKKNIEDVCRILELNQIIEDSEGAKVVFLNDIYPEEKIPPCIIKKSDGTTTYALRDIAAVLDRWQRFHFDEALYVINIGQQLHIKQFKGVLAKLKFPFADAIKHIAFGTMTFSGQKMQTRKGTILFLQDIYDEVYSEALNITREKNIAENSEDTAKKLAVGAIIFSILKNQRIKDIDFDFSKVLNFEGDTAAYLQYTAVRIKSIFKKAQKDYDEIFDYINKDKNKQSEYLGNLFYEICLNSSNNENGKKDEKNDVNQKKQIIEKLIFELYRFDEIIEEVVKQKEPYLLSRYLLKIAMLFNQFYSKVKILEGNEEEENIKLAFINSIEKTLENGLKLLGIEVPASL